MVNDLTITLFGDMLNKRMTLKKALSILDDMGLIHIGELAEKAISKKKGVPQLSRCAEGADLEDGTEIKAANSYPTSRNNGRDACIAGLRNKTTTLHTVIRETLTERCYFFKIPYWAYKDQQGSVLHFPFYADGSPLRNGVKRTRPNYWDFEIASFDELCKD